MEYQNQGNKKTMTTTHIRTLYSDGSCYITVKFYDKYLSLTFTPRENNDYNKQRTIFSSIDYEGAALLLFTFDQIIQGNKQDCMVNITNPINNTTLSFTRNNNISVLSISRGNDKIAFKFNTMTRQIGNSQDTVETGLIVLANILRSYLSGINSSRHLNKMTDDFIKSQEGKPDNKQDGYKARNQQSQGYQRGRGNYNRGNYNQNYQPDTSSTNMDSYDLPM